MSWENYDDVVQQLQAAGLIIRDGLHIGTSKPWRCHVEGEDGEKRGWYWLNDILLDKQQPDGTTQRALYLVGSFGCYHGNDNGKQKISLAKDAPALSAEQREAMRARHAENAKRAAAMRKDEAVRAAHQAGSAWAKYLPEGQSDYLQRKNVPAYGLRFSPSGNGTVAIPMLDTGGRIWGLQIIRGKERGNRLEKQYWPAGLEKKGHFYLLGGTPNKILLIAEGYATAASLHQATGHPVAVAFDANNILPVAGALHKAYKHAHILICADDDYLTAGNPGVTAAENAALAVSGAHVKPDFPTDRGGKKLTDFNDLAVYPQGGLALVRVQIESAIARAGWSFGSTAARDVPARGEGKDGNERREAVSTLPLDELVERFIHIDDDTGEYAFDTWTRQVCKFTKVTKMLPARVRNDDIKDHPTWKSRAVYIDQIGFDPGGDDKNIVCNRWNGWPTQPKPGKCEVLLDLLRYLCSGESNSEEIYQWILKWLAYPIQHPGAKMHSALVVHGPQGTGKSRFFEAHAKIYGDYSIVLNQGAIEDKFNADWCERRLLVVADEIVARADMYHLKNQLKGFITGEWVRVNPKNVAAHRERNHMNIVFLSNEKQPVVLENDDRRHLIIWTPPKLSEEFYEELDEEISAGGIAALHEFMLKLDLGKFKPWTHPPMTEAKRELIVLGMGSEERFVREWVMCETEYPCCPCSSNDLYRAYVNWARENGEIRPRAKAQFLAHVAKSKDWACGKQQSVYESFNYTGKPKQIRMVFPPEHSMKEEYRHKENETETVRSTRCLMEFRQSLNGETVK